MEDKPTLKEIADYELHNAAESIISINTWITAIMVLGFLALLGQTMWLVGICIVLVIILNADRNVKSGQVREYQRKKKGIPNANQIKKMKEEYLNKEEVIKI